MISLLALKCQYFKLRGLQFHFIKQLKNGHPKFLTLPFWSQWRCHDQIKIASSSCLEKLIGVVTLPHSCPLEHLRLLHKPDTWTKHFDSQCSGWVRKRRVKNYADGIYGWFLTKNLKLKGREKIPNWNHDEILLMKFEKCLETTKIFFQDFKRRSTCGQKCNKFGKV